NDRRGLCAPLACERRPRCQKLFCSRQLLRHRGSKEEREKMATNPLTPEQELAEHWRKKACLNKSDFDSLQPIPFSDDRTVEHVKHELARRIFDALPLTEEEYYLAIAFKFLLTGVPYKVFFMNHWHESVEHRAYKSAHDCEFCQDLRGKKLRRKEQEAQ